MANKNLIDGAALVGASQGFNPYGAKLTAQLMDMDQKVAKVAMAKKAIINQRTASYINQLNTEMDVTQLDPSQQAAVKNYLVQNKQIYAQSANRLAKMEPTDPRYTEEVDKLNNIKSSFANLAAELNGYKEDKLNYIKDFDNGALSDGNKINTLNNASKIYTNEGIMGIGEGGTLNFWNDGKEEFVSYKQTQKPFLKDFEGADQIMKLNENAYNSGQVLQGARKNLMRQRLNNTISKGGRDSLLSLASDDFIIEGGLNIEDPSLFEPENEQLLKDLVIDSYMDAFVESSIQGANEKRPSSRSQSGGYSGAVQDEINANQSLATQLLDFSGKTAGNANSVVETVNSLDSSSTNAKYISQANLYEMFLEGEGLKNNTESSKLFIDEFGNYDVYRYNPSQPHNSRGIQLDTQDPQAVYNFYINNSGMGKKTRTHYINSYSSGKSKNKSNTNTGSLDNL